MFLIESNERIESTADSAQNEDNPTKKGKEKTCITLYHPIFLFLYFPSVMEEMSKKAISTTIKLTSEALQLQGKYHKLLHLVQTSCREAELEPMKNILRSILQEKSLYQQAAIAKYTKEINSLSSVDQFFQFLVEKHFISYLNFQLLKEFSIKTICGLEASRKIEKEISEYQKHFKSFMDIPEFSTLIQVFDENPHLNPSTIVGLPIVIISLFGSWKHRNRKELTDWIPFLRENKELLQSMGYKCILITYAIFPIDLPEVMTFLNDYNKMEELKKNGITIEISEEATTMFKLLSSPDVSMSISKLQAEMKVLQQENAKLKEMINSSKETQDKMIDVQKQTQDKLTQNEETIQEMTMTQNQDKLMAKALHQDKKSNDYHFTEIQNGEHQVQVPTRERSKSVSIRAKSERRRPQYLLIYLHRTSYPGPGTSIEERATGRPLSFGGHT